MPLPRVAPVNMASVLKTRGHAAFSLYYHLVLTTKYRHKCLTSEMLVRLREVLVAVLADWRCELIEFNGEADHVHLLLSAHPALNLASLVGNLKTVSAHRLRAEFADHLRPFYWKPMLWNRAYAVVNVGSHASLEVVMKYIQDQETPPASSSVA